MILDLWGNNIAQVQDACVDIITEVLDSPNEPIDYILVTFNDPELQNVTGSDVYYAIAEATGGKVYQISTSEIADVMKDITKELLPSATAVVKVFNLDTIVDHFVNVSVDNMITNIKVTIIGAASTAEVDVDSLLSAIDFDYTITEEADDGYLYKVIGNPIIDQTYTIFLTVYNLPENATVTTLLLTESSGSENRFTLTKITSDFYSTYFCSTSLISEFYQISIYGTDDNGTTWTRTSPNTISPVNVKLALSSTPGMYHISRDIPPMCSVDTLNGQCDNNYGNGSCLDSSWTGQATITFTTDLQSVTGSNGMNVDTGSVLSSPSVVTVSGTCCTPSTYLTIIDKNNNFVRCHFFLGDEQIAVGVIAGIVLACLLATVTFVIVVYRKGVKPKLNAMKVDNLNREAVKTLPMKKENSSKQLFYDDFMTLKYDFKSQPPRDTHFPHDLEFEISDLQ
ncbi:unnamed protein product [Mytilus edulis]|uniref:Hemicentin-1-like von Willebrand factor A domain-containing protein n=1 Tax=Mytilus edulis TaxID=6550 RepID=A0A8S3V531_MYTED|nr:unnamed protein product [Mytilus edulis]